MLTDSNIIVTAALDDPCGGPKPCQFNGGGETGRPAPDDQDWISLTSHGITRLPLRECVLLQQTCLSLGRKPPTRAATRIRPCLGAHFSSYRRYPDPIAFFRQSASLFRPVVARATS